MTEIVRVYRNLRNRPGRYSIQRRTDRGWRVTEHADRLCMYDVTFVISHPSRRRALRNGRKNAHAFAVGRIATSGCYGSDGRKPLAVKIRYDMTAGAFRSSGFTPPLIVRGARGAVLNEDGISVAYLTDSELDPQAETAQ